MACPFGHNSLEAPGRVELSMALYLMRFVLNDKSCHHPFNMQENHL